MILLNLDVIALMCSPNVKDASNRRPFFFCDKNC